MAQKRKFHIHVTTVFQKDAELILIEQTNMPK